MIKTSRCSLLVPKFCRIKEKSRSSDSWHLSMSTTSIVLRCVIGVSVSSWFLPAFGAGRPGGHRGFLAEVQGRTGGCQVDILPLRPLIIDGSCLDADSLLLRTGQLAKRQLSFLRCGPLRMEGAASSVTLLPCSGLGHRKEFPC